MEDPTGFNGTLIKQLSLKPGLFIKSSLAGQQTG
jgi:hypothetical protein